MPGFGVPPLLLLPQPIAAMEARKTSIPSIDSHLRRRAGMPKNNTRASTAPPAEGQKGLFGSLGLLSAVAAPVVFTVNTSVCAVVPLTVTDADARLHVGRSAAPVGEELMVQLIATAPVNPPDGVTLIVEVLPVVAPGLTVILPLLVRAKLGTGAAVTLTVTVVVWAIEPEVPVTEIV